MSPEPTTDNSPSRYIERVSLVTGEVLSDPIRPEELLVHSHRDYHIVDVQARVAMSALVEATGDEEVVRGAMKQVRRLGKTTTGLFKKLIGEEASKKLSKTVFGYERAEHYFRYKRHALPKHQIYARIEGLQDEAGRRLAALGEPGQARLRVLLTGGTGFVGKEIMWQAAHDPEVAEVVVVIRPKTVRDRKTQEVLEVIQPAERGARLLNELWLRSDEERSKFRFVNGDVEQPNLGIAEEELAVLRETTTHVIHSAASVAFDDPYPKSFQANVLGTLNALEFSRGLQEAAGSPFVAHLGIETSYIHGRQVRDRAREDEIVFPRNFYNNYYELTKAMASLETERFLLEHGLRVVQLCPAIVIGESGTGNNRGDTKVVNAPVNVFGRAQEALTNNSQAWTDRSKGWVLARMACVFPSDPSAEMNLIPVDWVVRGILAALKRPRAVGERVHLATDNRITSEEIRDIVFQELGVRVALADPTLHRNVTLPVLTRLLNAAGQDRLGKGLEKLGTIFASYSEWGQPIHEVGNDVRVLGLPEPRPNTVHAFRMLCRHNRYVQEFGKVKDEGEISRREEVWRKFCFELEAVTGAAPGSLSAARFTEALQQRLDLADFSLRSASY